MSKRPEKRNFSSEESTDDYKPPEKRRKLSSTAAVATSTNNQRTPTTTTRNVRQPPVQLQPHQLLPPRAGCFISITLNPASIRFEIPSRQGRQMWLNAVDVAAITKHVFSQTKHLISHNNCNDSTASTRSIASAYSIYSAHVWYHLMQLIQGMYEICNCNANNHSGTSLLASFAKKYRVGYDFDLLYKFQEHEKASGSGDKNWKCVTTLGCKKVESFFWRGYEIAPLRAALQAWQGFLPHADDLIRGMELFKNPKHENMYKLKTWFDVFQEHYKPDVMSRNQLQQICTRAGKAADDVVMFEKCVLQTLAIAKKNANRESQKLKRVLCVMARNVGGEPNSLLTVGTDGDGIDWSQVLTNKSDLMYVESEDFENAKDNSVFYYYVPVCVRDRKRFVSWGKLESELMSELVNQYCKELNGLKCLCDIVGLFCGGTAEDVNTQTLLQMFRQLVEKCQK